MFARNVCLTIFLILAPVSGFSLNITLAPEHYVEAMEFYYKSPRAELIPPMLRSLAQSRFLANGEKRMFTAAFLSGLIQTGALKPASLVGAAQGLGRDARLTAAWALHLAGAGDKALQDLLTPGDAPFARQIRQSPASLRDWDPAWENSVLGMYWGAFMSTGNPAWIDGIITAALKFAANGATNRPAASLYEYAPRHPAVAERLRARLPEADSAGKRMIETILTQKID